MRNMIIDEIILYLHCTNQKERGQHLDRLSSLSDRDLMIEFKATILRDVENRSQRF